jgi:preprotein translocase subunit YajC
MPEWLNVLGATPAYAQAAPAGGAGNFMYSFAPFILIFVLFYLLLIRPQQKRQKLHRQMLEALKKGDKVVTNGGLLGTVAAVTKEVVTLQVADNVRLRVLRAEVMGLQGEVTEGAAPKNGNDKESKG